jgi:prepilin-type N-terminal cleavage/methylation domain-containing protein
LGIKVRPYLRKVSASARREAGFGMVELLCAMTILAVGILAVFALFHAGIVNISRASTITTAGALADTEMERFRAVKYSTLGLAQIDVDAIASGDPYKNDSAWRPISSPVNELNSTVVVTKCPATPCTDALPSRTATGADGKSYRVDTYMTWHAVENASGTPGRNVKLITIVIRDAQSPTKVWARATSSFDESTGL